MPEGSQSPGAKKERGPRRLVIWRFADGKSGHDNQSFGLAEALAEQLECEILTLSPLSAPKALACLVAGRGFSDLSPDPDLILGAGHATHLSMLAARRSRGGRAVVLMTPTLPRRLFDLCLIPEHDQIKEDPGTVVTRGALNRVRPGSKLANYGLILVGGPSRHFAWHDEAVLQQIRSIIERDAGTRWTLTTSRRTPGEFSRKLLALESTNVSVKPVTQTPSGWLVQELGRASKVWVTEESASMVYEALSGGAAVGLLSLEAKRPNRVSRGIDRLVTAGTVVRFENWFQGNDLEAPKSALSEAQRCAAVIIARWPDLAVRQ